VRVLRRVPRTAKAAPLAVSKAGATSYRNGNAAGVYVYLEVRPSVRAVDYTLRLTAARR
jgi:hypothetical protein